MDKPDIVITDMESMGEVFKIKPKKLKFVDRLLSFLRYLKIKCSCNSKCCDSSCSVDKNN